MKLTLSNFSVIQSSSINSMRSIVMKLAFLNFTNRENTSIDSVRFIAAVAVIFIHSNLHIVGGVTENIALAFMPIARLAVPFFFIASGYFMFTDNYAKAKERYLKSILKLTSIFILSSLLYFVFYSLISKSFSETFSLLSAQSIFNMVFFNQPVYNTVLWFILALLSVNAVFYLKAKFKVNDTVFFLFSLVLFIFGLMWGGNYSSIIHSEYVGATVYRSFIGMGLIFTTIGYLLRKHQIKFSEMPTIRLVRYSILTLGLYLVEFFALSHNNPSPADVYIMTPVVSAILFIWLIKYPFILNHTIIPKLGVSISLYIYIIHHLLIDTVGWVYPKIGLDVLHPKPAILRFIIVVMGSIIISYLYLYVKVKLQSFIQRNQNKFTFLQILTE